MISNCSKKTTTTKKKEFLVSKERIKMTLYSLQVPGCSKSSLRCNLRHIRGCPNIKAEKVFVCCEPTTALFSSKKMKTLSVSPPLWFRWEHFVTRNTWPSSHNIWVNRPKPGSSFEHFQSTAWLQLPSLRLHWSVDPSLLPVQNWCLTCAAPLPKTHLWMWSE